MSSVIAMVLIIQLQYTEPGNAKMKKSNHNVNVILYKASMHICMQVQAPLTGTMPYSIIFATTFDKLKTERT